MASSSIAGALRVSKSAFNRAVILRTAHAAARKRMAPSCDYRFGDRWNNEAGGYVAHSVTYRDAFRSALQWAWRDAKLAAEDAAWEAAQPKIPTDVVDHVAALRAFAWSQPITAAGNERMSEIYAESFHIENAARIAAATQGAVCHVAC